jgi:hypothetical protein
MHCSIAANGKDEELSKQWSIELFLTVLRSGDGHSIVGDPIIILNSQSVILETFTNYNGMNVLSNGMSIQDPICEKLWQHTMEN